MQAFLWLKITDFKKILTCLNFNVDNKIKLA